MHIHHRVASEHYRSILIHNRLNNFINIWNLHTDWFETPNNKRYGWSGVSRIELKTPEGGVLNVFLKRQQNYNTFSLQHPFGQPTFKREYNNMLKMQALGLPIASLVYYGEQRIDGQTCAALMTVALDDFSSMDKWWTHHTQPEARHTVLAAIADWIALLSKQKWQYGCLYDKHIFIRNTKESNQFDKNDICFIDLEKMRRRLTVKRAAKRNIQQLLRHSQCCTKEEQQHLTVEFNKRIECQVK